jgi:hypothetical protein
MLNRNNVALYLIIISIAISCGCAKPSNQPLSEGPPAPAPETEQPQSTQPQQAPILKPPSLDESRAKLAFVYEEAVTMDEKHRPTFVAGDFNGDGSEDIAIVVNPVKEKLADINSEYANWILGDAKAVGTGNPGNGMRQASLMTRQVVTESDATLLAIIHGHGTEGWRNFEARQTYLLKHAVGERMKTNRKDKLLKSNKSDKPMPQIRGDVISQILEGQEGFIYYTGAKYGWYDPKTYRPEPVARSPHSGMSSPK